MTTIRKYKRLLKSPHVTPADEMNLTQTVPYLVTSLLMVTLA